jgi:hypothetical protein
MKHLITLLIFISAPVWAAWEEVVTGVSGDVAYIDPATIKKDGSIRRFWGLTDLANPTSEGILSRRYLREIDCKNERTRILTISGHSKAMGDGVTLGINAEVQSWNYIAPETVMSFIQKRVCSN